MSEQIQPWPVVKKGDNAHPVKTLQTQKHLPVDGDFGPKTDVFVKGFQEALGLTKDGIVGPLTWRALVSGMLAG